jgi:hypothetical protein
MADADPQKRTKLIDRLLDDPRHATHQADVWDLTLFGRNPPNGDATRKRDDFRAWLAGKFAANEPYDRWVREGRPVTTDVPSPRETSFTPSKPLPARPTPNCWSRSSRSLLRWEW